MTRSLAAIYPPLAPPEGGGQGAVFGSDRHQMTRSLAAIYPPLDPPDGGGQGTVFSFDVVGFVGMRMGYLFLFVTEWAFIKPFCSGVHT
jgi:hypothetical protein